MDCKKRVERERRKMGNGEKGAGGGIERKREKRREGEDEGFGIRNGRDKEEKKDGVKEKRKRILCGRVTWKRRGEDKEKESDFQGSKGSERKWER